MSELNDNNDRGPAGWLRKALPWAVLALAVLAVLRGAVASPPTGDAGLDLGGLAKTPVLADGRVKPLDTVARTELLILSGRQELGYWGRERSALQWLADVMVRPAEADRYPVFRIDHEGVLELVGLTRGDGVDKKRFSYAQLGTPARRAAVAREAGLAGEVESDDRDAYQSAVVGLEQHLRRYEGLQTGAALGLAPPGPGEEREAWLTGFEASRSAALASADGLAMQTAWATVLQVRTRGVSPQQHAQHVLQEWAGGRVPAMMAYAAAFYQFHTEGEASWAARVPEFAQMVRDPTVVELAGMMRPYFERFESEPTAYALIAAAGPEHAPAGASSFVEALEAYRAGDGEALEAALARRAEVVRGRAEVGAVKPAFESWFNRFMPFLQAEVLNLAAFVLGFVVLFFGRTQAGTWGRSLWWSVMALLLVALVVHTLGLGARVWLQGRPPVTNLYSSAVFIGWFAALVCLVVEWFSRLGIAAVTGALIGFVTLIIAHHLHLAFEEDTMQPMQAVLDSNFWLATHVITITIGYAATFVAGILAAMYILLGLATPTLDRPKARLITQMVYGTLCFALLFSFVGTVLGGIWADQSWGRFWGWDPKENGAVLIVMMIALTLHAKWGRMIKERGLMCLAVAGNIVTGWSWFGTNLLGVGLHSYGFMEGAMLWLLYFAVVNLVLIGVALAVPTNVWWSFRPKKKRPTEPRSRASLAGA